MTDKVVQQYNERQMQTLKKDLPKFRPGDTLSIQSRITEGTRERLQTFKGVLIAQRRAGIHSSVTLRDVSNGEGIERLFHIHSPAVASISVIRRGDVRRAKLYYLRNLSGRAARIREKLVKKVGDLITPTASASADNSAE